LRAHDVATNLYYHCWFAGDWITKDFHPFQLLLMLLYLFHLFPPFFVIHVLLFLFISFLPFLLLLLSSSTIPCTHRNKRRKQKTNKDTTKTSNKDTKLINKKRESKKQINHKHLKQIATQNRK
jgi:hypothetical protein